MTERVTQKRQPKNKQVGAFARAFLPSFGSLSLLLVLFLLLTNSFRFLGDSDTGWHIRTGDNIWKVLAVPRQDLFSHTMSDGQWYAWEWLTDVVMSRLHEWQGLGGVVAGAILLLLVGYMALYRVMLWRGSGPFVACVMTVFCSLACIVHWLARPHLVSIVLMVFWGALLENFRRERSALVWIVPLLVALWANLHGAFIITFVLLIVYAVGEWLEFAAKGRFWDDEMKRIFVTYGSLLGVSFLASLATPYTYRLFGHLWRYLSDDKLLSTIQEFQSPNFHTLNGRFLEILLLLGAIAATNALRQKKFVELGLFLLWSHMMLKSERHVTLAAVTLTPIIAEQMTQLLGMLGDRIALLPRHRLVDVFLGMRNWYRGFLKIHVQINDAFICVVVGFFIIFTARTGLKEQLLSPHFDKRRFPVEAAEWVKANPPHGPMFADDQYGGYLIYSLFPENIRVFVDGRSDFYRAGGVLEDADKISSVEPGWREALDRRGVQWMVLNRNEPLAQIAELCGEWRIAYQDQTAKILIRNTSPANPAVPGEAKSDP